VSREAARRALLGLATFAYLLALGIALTGGGILTIGSLRLSIRGTRNPLLVLALTLAAALALSPRGRRWRTLADEWAAITAPFERIASRLAIRPATAAAAIAAGVAAVGILVGTGTAGAADSYGYVSQARLWANGELRVEQPLLRNLPDGIAPETLVPLGYRLSTDRQALVPVYAAGYPMVMALFERIGGPDAVYLVMPLLAGVAVWCTYLLGASLVSPVAGLIAAALLATSPSVLFILTHSPMSDIPAMAWWMLALVAGIGSSARSSLLSGLAAGAAILTRPNLVPLVVIVAALQTPVGRDRDLSAEALAKAEAAPPTRATAIRRLLLFAIGPIVAALIVAALNATWYGSPTEAGYGTLAGVLYRWEFIGETLRRYPAWLWDTQRWTVLAAVAGGAGLWMHRLAPARPRPLLVCGTFAIGVCLSYAFYLPLVEWWTLRFLFPALPLLCILAAMGVLRLPPRPRLLPAAAAVLMAALGIAAARDRAAFDTANELRYRTAGRYIADRLPPKAVVLSMIHSGSANFYSGRQTMRWDMLRPEQLDPLVADLRQHGYAPYILLDDFEEQLFSKHFTGASRLGPLDWPPLLSLPRVRLFDATPPGRIE
jgi:hypothetical protein